MLSSLIQPSQQQVHRQVPLTNAKIAPTTKIALQDLLKNLTIILKNSNDIGQIDLIEMRISTRPDATPTVAYPYTLVLKHHDFLKQEIHNLLDTEIIHKSMSPLAMLKAVVKNHTPEGSP